MESKKSNAISVSVADQETREQNDDAFENEPRQPPGDSQKKTIAKIATTSISLRQKNRSNFGQQGTTMSAMSGVIRPILGKQPPQPLSQQPKPPQQAQQSQFKQQPQSQQPQSKPQSLSQSKSRSSSSAAASSSQSQPPSQQQQLQQKQPTPQQQQPQPPTLSSQPPSQQKMPVTTAQSKSVALYSGGSAGEWIGGTSQIVGNVSGNLNPRPKSKSCCKRQMELQTPTKSVTFSERNAGEDVGAGGPGGPVGSGPGGPDGGAGVVGVVVVVAGTGGGNQMEAKSKSTPTPITAPSASTGNSSSSNNSNKIGQHSFKKSVRSMFSKKSTSSSSKATKQSSMGKTSEKLSFKSDGSGGGGAAVKKSLLQKLPKISKRIVNPIASTVGSKMFKRPDIERLEQDSMLRYVPPPKTSLKLKRLPQKSQQKPQQKFQKSQQKSQLKSQPKLQPNSQPSLNPKQQSQAPTSGSSGSGKAITDPNVTMKSTNKIAPTTKTTSTIKTMTKSKVSSTAKTTKPTTPAANYHLSIADKHMLGSSVTVGASNNIGGSKEFQNPDALFPDSGETNVKDVGSGKNCSYCGGCIGGSVGSGPINFCFCGRSVAFRNPNLDSSKAAQNQPHPPPPLLTPVSSSNPQSASLQTGNPPPPPSPLPPSPSPPPPPPPPPLLTSATVDGSGGSNAKNQDPATPPTSPLIVIILAQNENMPPDSGTIQASTVAAPNSPGKAANPEMPGIGLAGLPESGQPQQQPQPPQAQQQEAPADLPPPPPPPPLNEVSVARWNVPASIHLDSNDMTFSNSRLPSEYPVPGNTSTMSLSANSVAVDLQQQQQQRWPLRTIDPFIKQQQQPQQQQQPKQQPQQQQQQQQQPFVFILAAKEQVPNTNDPQVGKNTTLAASPSTESIDTGSSLASKSATNSKLDII